MWIGTAFILAGGLYLAWCLVKGKIFVTLGTDLHKNTRLVDRDENPRTFWVTWAISAVALVVFAGYLIRLALR